MNKEILEKAKQIKDENFELSKQMLIDSFYESERFIYGLQKLTSQQIEERIKEDLPSLGGEIMRLEQEYNPENMNNHDPKIKGLSIKSLCEDLRHLDYEVTRILMFDENDNYLGHDQEEGDKNSLSLEVMNKVRDRVLENNKVRKVINVHNHPRLVCAIPSIPDTTHALKSRIEFQEKGVELIDDCIISELDFYSRKTKELEINTADAVLTINTDAKTLENKAKKSKAISNYLKNKKHGIY